MYHYVPLCTLCTPPNELLQYSLNSSWKTNYFKWNILILFLLQTKIITSMGSSTACDFLSLTGSMTSTVVKVDLFEYGCSMTNVTYFPLFFFSSTNILIYLFLRSFHFKESLEYRGQFFIRKYWLIKIQIVCVVLYSKCPERNYMVKKQQLFNIKTESDGGPELSVPL